MRRPALGPELDPSRAADRAADPAAGAMDDAARAALAAVDRRAPRRAPLPSRSGRRRAARARARGRAPRAVGGAVAAVALRRRALDRDPRARARRWPSASARARRRASGRAPALFLDQKVEGVLEAPVGVCVCCVPPPAGTEVLGRGHDPGDRPLLDGLRDPEPVAHGARRGPRRRLGQLLPARRAARRARHPRRGRAGRRGCAWAGPTSGRCVPAWSGAAGRARAAGRRRASHERWPARRRGAARAVAAARRRRAHRRARPRRPAGQAGRQPRRAGGRRRALERRHRRAAAGAPARRRSSCCAADHGHAARGTSLFDGAVSGQVAAAAARGETAIGVLARAREETLWSPTSACAGRRRRAASIAAGRAADGRLRRRPGHDDATSATRRWPPAPSWRAELATPAPTAWSSARSASATRPPPPRCCAR